MRIAINMIGNLLDPETIVIGGNADNWLIEAQIEESSPLHPSPASRNRATPRVMPSIFREDISAIGASDRPITPTLDPSSREPEAS